MLLYARREKIWINLQISRFFTGCGDIKTHFFHMIFNIFVNCGNKLRSFCVTEHYVAVLKIFLSVGKSLRHTACKHNNSVRIFSADFIDKLTIFSVAYRSYGAAVYNSNIGRCVWLGKFKSVFFRRSSRIACDSYWFTLQPRVIILKIHTDFPFFRIICGF